jgi:hypothetical protein
MLRDEQGPHGQQDVHRAISTGCSGRGKQVSKSGQISHDAEVIGVDGRGLNGVRRHYMKTALERRTQEHSGVYD